MRIRLDKLLANMGTGSRKEVKEYIGKGHVRVNGKVELSPKKIVCTELDQITLDDRIIEYQKYVYYMLNKPDGVISATRDRRTTVLDLINDEDKRDALYPVGRLDIDTTGLLLITDDGRLGHKLLSPKNDIKKVYLAEVDEKLSEEDVEKFSKGFLLQPENIYTKDAKLEILKDKLGKVTISEGKYHQVKRMFEKCGKEVLRLKRISMGSLILDNGLEEGEYRPLTDDEKEKLFSLIGRGE